MVYGDLLITSSYAYTMVKRNEMRKAAYWATGFKYCAIVFELHPKLNKFKL